MRTILEKRLVNILSYTWYMLLVRGMIAIGLSLFVLVREDGRAAALRE